MVYSTYPTWCRVGTNDNEGIPYTIEVPRMGASEFVCVLLITNIFEEDLNIQKIQPSYSKTHHIALIK